MSWQVLFQQSELRISWWLCNNSEIHLWLCKVWSLVVCSQNSFYVTGARKDNKNRQNTLLFLNSLPDNQLFNIVPIQSTIYRKKKLFVDNKVQNTTGDLYPPTCRNGKCVYVSTNKTSSFYDCEKCKVCCHVLKFPLWTKCRLYCGLVVIVHKIFRKRQVASTKKRTHLLFEEIPPPITIKQTRTKAKKWKSFSIHDIIVLTPLLLMQLTKNSFCFFFLCTFSLQ